MHSSGRKRAQLVGLFLLGCLMFNYPLLAIFDVPSTIFGVPVIFAYLFLAWALLVALLARIMARVS